MKAILPDAGLLRHPALQRLGAAAAPCDLALLNVRDDGFLTEPGAGMNYLLREGGCVDRFGREGSCAAFGLRPAILLDAEDDPQAILGGVRREHGLVTAEYGVWPTRVLSRSLRDMALRAYREGSLPDTGRRIHPGGEELRVLRFGARELVAVTAKEGGANGFVTLSDGTVAGEGETLLLELRPLRWIWLEDRNLLLCGSVLCGAPDNSPNAAQGYLSGQFLSDLVAPETEPARADRGFRLVKHDELSLIRAYVDADVPLFLHGLSGDGKSARVLEIDPQALDIELVNETPETINGRAIFHEARNEIIDVKPVWLVKLEKLCEDGGVHILFFDELTNATKQTQSVIFKIVLERVVNNRWPLPKNARIVAAGNDRSESSAAHDLAEPLYGRFAHLTVRTTVENWMPWAMRRDINPFVMEFLANNDLYLRTPYTGEGGYADPRRWEMASKVLDASGNDFSLLAPLVGNETAEEFIRFFRSREHELPPGSYTDEELSKLSVARKYQLARQCLTQAAAKPGEAEALVSRLGAEYLSWYRYMLRRRETAE